MKKRYSGLFICALFALASCGKSSSDPVTPYTPPAFHPPVDSGWTFSATPSWSEEFNSTGPALPDAANWSYDIGGSGWGNNEKEYYTNDISNAKVENGMLTITAKKEPMGGMNYTSARLKSMNQGDFLYGRAEIRAKLPAGKGTWPAIWMLPSGNWAYGDWPNSGEIDIMEHVGFDPNNVHFSAHTKSFNWTIGTQKTTTVLVPNATTDFHKYRIDWTPYAIRGFYDDANIFTFINDGKGFASWPFDKPFHLLLNVAVGGEWGGQQGVDDSVFPASMVVDYVRVYNMNR